jgi:hypothetical protein
MNNQVRGDNIWPAGILNNMGNGVSQDEEGIHDLLAFISEERDTIWPAGISNKKLYDLTHDKEGVRDLLKFIIRDRKLYEARKGFAKRKQMAKDAAAYNSISRIWDPPILAAPAAAPAPAPAQVFNPPILAAPSSLSASAQEFVPGGGYKKKAKKTRRRKNLKRTRRV